MQRVVRHVGRLLVGRDGEEHVGRLHADLEVVEVVLLQDVGVLARRLALIPRDWPGGKLTAYRPIAYKPFHAAACHAGGLRSTPTL
jgi:hypothetical protein